jgi:hypothetical protein
LVVFAISGGPNVIDWSNAEPWLLAHLLLSGDCLLRSLAGASVGVGALTVDRKPLAVANTLVTADLHLPLDVLSYVAAKVTFDFEVGVDPGPEPSHLLVSQITDAGVGAYARLGAGLLRPGLADPVDIGQRDLETLLARDVDA